MNRILAVAVLSLFVLAVGAGDRSFAAGAQKKDPVRLKVLNTFQTDLEGVDKAQLIQFEMDPGAEVKNFNLGTSEIVWVTQGTFTYKYGEKTVVRKQGESWYHQQGIVLDVYNKGKSAAVLRGVQFIRKK